MQQPKQGHPAVQQGAECQAALQQLKLEHQAWQYRHQAHRAVLCQWPKPEYQAALQQMKKENQAWQHLQLQQEYQAERQPKQERQAVCQLQQEQQAVCQPKPEHQAVQHRWLKAENQAAL